LFFSPSLSNDERRNCPREKVVEPKRSAVVVVFILLSARAKLSDVKNWQSFFGLQLKTVMPQK